MAKILVVDDERSILEFFEIFLTQEGYEVDTVDHPVHAFEKLTQEAYDLVITDLSMPNANGLDVLKKVKGISSEATVIIMTAYATAESAIEAMRSGAYDYIMKPFVVDDIRHTIRNAIEKSQLRKENKNLKQKLGASPVGLTRFIGKSEKMRQVCDLLQRVAQNKSTILLCGESGTGKELAAKAIHELSPRYDKPFISINCGAIPENLIESELFGYAKGAFTGADRDKVGLFEAASTGTIFLDEISELPFHMQVKLLRVLQEKVVRRIGGTEDISVDVRVISATNKSLEKESKEGRFREDLYYRLNVIQVQMPSLRERTEDIPLLIQAFIKKFSTEQEKKIIGIQPEAVSKLCEYAFPGNIRELENLMEQSVALETTEMIQMKTLPSKVAGQAPHAEVSSLESISEHGIDLENALSSYERVLIMDALKVSRGVRRKAADLLRISFRSMRYRLIKHQIHQEDE